MRFIFVFSLCCLVQPFRLAAAEKKRVVFSSISTHIQPDTIPKASKTAVKKSNISFTAVGDIMLGSNYPNQSSLPPLDGKYLLSEVDSLLKSTDVTFGNLEGTFMDSGGIPKGSGPNLYCFRQPKKYAVRFKESGFDFLSIANNHINDFGPSGISSTVRTLSNYGLNFGGIPSSPYSIIVRDSLKIGFIAFAPHSGCLDLNDEENAQAMVKELKAKCDILMVSFHGGAEGTSHQHVTRKREYFFGQDRGNVYDFSHMMIDAGADIVIGHGPHVARGIELYKSRIIAYSLGNFCTYGQFNLKGVSGVAPLLQFEVDRSGNFQKGRIHSFRQLKEGGPIRDMENSAASNITVLSRQDFPQNPITIDEDGYIRIQK